MSRFDPITLENEALILQEPDTAQWRPQWHFTPQKNWINDPNGLVYFEGEYHLFFQYNPHGKDWGHMSWGHAVSTDLVNWTELPVAIPEREYMIFSGSALVDWKNTTGLGDGHKPPLIAFFTAFHEADARQTQCIAYSHDKGRTWKMYDGNPVIDLDMEHFRDPNVFWHDPSQAWIMSVALPRAHKVQIYRSDNLRDWSLASEFGPVGATSGQWECPALIEVPSRDDTSIKRWVMKVDVDNGLIEDGSGAQYSIGNFDGYTFHADAGPDGPLAHIADHGKDFYAAINWSDLPETHQYPVWIGWMSNHQTGKDYPTHPWRGAMTLPRELFVFKENEEWRLGQRPVALPDTVISNKVMYADQNLQSGDHVSLIDLSPAEPVCLNMTAAAEGDAMAQIILSDEVDQLMTLNWNGQTIRVDYRQPDTVTGHYALYAHTETDTVRSVDGTIDITVVIDASLIEVFINGGERVMTQSVFPHGQIKLSFAAEGSSAVFKNIRR